ncbi:hypothetical protein BJX99DRAFT_262648 [Aspergillus californicus]
MDAKPTTPVQPICITCSKKKVKCDLGKQNPCSNCAKAKAKCVPYDRKRKREELKTKSPAVKKEKKGEKEKSAEKDDSGQTPAKARRPPRIDTLAAELDAIQSQEVPDATVKRHLSYDEAMFTPTLPNANSQLPLEDMRLLREEGAFTFPSNEIQEELIATFMEYGHVWMPIIDPAWFSGTDTSYLLLQAMFLAASRMTSQPNEYGDTVEFYRRAKLLFFFGIERNPLISIASALLLHWYNPVGPETPPTDTSVFWLRTAESIAFQIGLHKEPSAKDRGRGFKRRLWWAIVLRDSLISAGAGQPRTLNPKDTAVVPPVLDDFPEVDAHARVFPVYVTISQMLGDTVERCLRDELTPECQRGLESLLFRWVKQDFPCVTGPFPGFSFEARQVLVTYLATLVILDRSSALGGSPSARSLLASSFIAGLYREFLERDEVCRLGSAFTFYALCAGTILVSAAQVKELWGVLNEETIMLKATLQVLSRQWGSGSAAASLLQKLGDDSGKQSKMTEIPRLNEEARPFFEGLDTRWCRLWGPIVDYIHEQPDLSLHSRPSKRGVLEEYAALRPNGPPPLPITYPAGKSKDVNSDGGGLWLLSRTPSSPR